MTINILVGSVNSILCVLRISSIAWSGFCWLLVVSCHMLPLFFALNGSMGAITKFTSTHIHHCWRGCCWCTTLTKLTARRPLISVFFWLLFYFFVVQYKCFPVLLLLLLCFCLQCDSSSVVLVVIVVVDGGGKSSNSSRNIVQLLKIQTLKIQWGK